MPQTDDVENERLQNSGAPKKEKTAADGAWKKVHGDIYRAPECSEFIACFVGAGAQLAIGSVVLLFTIAIQFSNSELSAYIYSSMMVVLALFGVINGYVTARYLKFFGNRDFKMAVGISALVLPLFIMGVFFVELGLAYV